eukprot:24737-Pyramimonas_sp.AAC.1
MNWQPNSKSHERTRGHHRTRTTDQMGKARASKVMLNTVRIAVATEHATPALRGHVHAVHCRPPTSD